MSLWGMLQSKGVLHLNKITISDGITTITMPKTREINVGGKIASSEIEMASGKRVAEVTGCRIIINAGWDYVPADTMAALTTMLRKGLFFTVGYPDPDGSYKSAAFSISIPAPGIFKFISGTPMWHGVSLVMASQEVV